VQQGVQQRLEHYATELAAPVKGDPKCPFCRGKTFWTLAFSSLVICSRCGLIFDESLADTGPESAT
jgi:rubredoxin